VLTIPQVGPTPGSEPCVRPNPLLHLLRQCHRLAVRDSLERDYQPHQWQALWARDARELHQGRCAVSRELGVVARLRDPSGWSASDSELRAANEPALLCCVLASCATQVVTSVCSVPRPNTAKP
jgi:hypothetical protein